MSKTMNIYRMMSAGLFIMILIAGCSSTDKVAPVQPHQVCLDTTVERLSNLTDEELSEALNNADDLNGLGDCWISLVKAYLDEGWDIPRKHLVKAIKTFNKRQHEKYFHKSLYRYFTVIAENPGSYRPEDRNLLDSYCSYLINSAESNRDRNLIYAKHFCRQLDQDLYARYFG